METTYAQTKILDHGYVKLIQAWGSDETIIESARMSTQKGFEGWGGTCKNCYGTGTVSSFIDFRVEIDCDNCKGSGVVSGDERLLAFLYRNNHATPFEFGGLVIEVQAPIFVFREWHRHRTQSYNEASARYAPLPDLDYVPILDRMLLNVNSGNKQAGTVKDAEELTHGYADAWTRRLAFLQRQLEKHYQDGLTHGVPKELARLSMTVGRYSKMRASTNLRNWLAFLTLRQAPNAQWEIRQYANAIAEIVAAYFPRTYALFSESK